MADSLFDFVFHRFSLFSTFIWVMPINRSYGWVSTSTVSNEGGDDVISLIFTFDLFFNGFLLLPVGFEPEVPKGSTTGRLFSNFHIVC